MDNKPVWAITENDIFTIKSAYFSALDHKGESRGTPSNTEVQTSKWKHIWNISVPTKLKNFL